MDEAWSKLPQARLDYLVSRAGVAELEQILSYHIVPGVLPSSDLVTNSTTSASSILAADGSNKDLKITKSANGQVKVNGIANVETADVVSRIESEVVAVKQQKGKAPKKLAHTPHEPLTTNNTITLFLFFLIRAVSLFIFRSQATVLSISLIQS
jgi:Fasciclin domain